MQAQTPALASPVLSPDFAIAVSNVRRDTTLALIGPRHAPSGFWAFHRRPDNFLRPAGAPLADWTGPILNADCTIDPVAFVGACNGVAARFPGLADPLQRFRAHWVADADRDWRIDLSSGVSAYRARLEAAQHKHLQNTLRCARKAAREIGEIGYTFDDRAPDVCAALFDWKRRQLQATGRHDFFGPAWTRALIERILDHPTPSLRTIVSSLRFGDRLAAAELYLRAGSLMHAWIAVYDRELAAYAPGHILTDCMLDAAESHGVQVIDFGAGNDAYKSRWYLESVPIYEALVHSANITGVVRRTMHRGWKAARPLTGNAGDTIARARRRFDQVASVEAAWMGAARGMVSALIARRPH
jgi:CelD/BcsL family acetyltransferase involved in cellulose biosynthesis